MPPVSGVTFVKQITWNSKLSKTRDYEYETYFVVTAPPSVIVCFRFFSTNVIYIFFYFTFGKVYIIIQID